MLESLGYIFVADSIVYLHSYAISYWSSIVTLVLSCPVWEILHGFLLRTTLPLFHSNFFRRWTQRLVWCSSPVDATTSLRCFIVSIGYTRVGANCLQASRASIPVPPSRRRPTWLTTYSWSPNFLADDAYVHRRPRHWWYHRPGFEPLAIELFPSQQQKRGTVCRRKWRHHDQHHFQPSNLNWKLTCFPCLFLIWWP